jgi:uncharacterized alpha-E superfamily protein
MLSRVADSLYWMSRYLERAEYTARIMGVHWNLMLEHDADSAGGPRWRRVLATLGVQEEVEGDAFAAAQTYALDQMVTCIAAARENARQVREQISSEMWEELNQLFHESKRIAEHESFDSQPHDVVAAVVRSSRLFQGITDTTMLHGEGWQFIQVGRSMERVQETVRMLDTHFSAFFRAGADAMSASEHMEWIGLLRACCAFEAYCKVYTAEMRPERVAEFLLLNAEFPHSVRFGVERLRRSLESVHQSTASRKSDRLGKVAGRLTAALSYTPIEEIMSNLHEFSTGIRRLCAQIHSGVYQVYITYPIEAALEA